jgi:hypothetical protein
MSPSAPTAPTVPPTLQRRRHFGLAADASGAEMGASDAPSVERYEVAMFEV